MTAQLPSSNRAFFDLSSRVKLRVTGADRVRFLNGQITNDIRKATETSSVEACVLNAKGKMDAHLFVHVRPGSFLIDADPALEPVLQARLARYIIADEVEIEDVTTQWSIFHVFAKAAPKLAGELGIISADRFGIPGYDVWCAPTQCDQIKRELAKEFTHCDDGCAEQLRIEQGIPRWGRELTGEIIPVEANLEHRCIDYEKGCYIGQETISRMKMSGQRNKQLCGLVSSSGVPFTLGMRLLGGKVDPIRPDGPEDKDVGWITSSTRSGDREVALGYVKRGFNSTGAKLEASAGGTSRISVQVVDLPFLRLTITAT